MLHQHNVMRPRELRGGALSKRRPTRGDGPNTSICGSIIGLVTFISPAVQPDLFSLTTTTSANGDALVREIWRLCSRKELRRLPDRPTAHSASAHPLSEN